MNELVSVIIPTFNRHWLLRRAIASVLNQTYKNLEVIVINDGDKGLVNYLNFNDPRLQVIDDGVKSCDFLGYPSGGYSRNKGLSAANGKYIVFLDDDDQFLPNKIEMQLNDLMLQESARASCTDAYISIFPYPKMYYKKFSDFYSDARVSYFSQLGLMRMPHSLTNEILQVHNFIITSTVMIEASLVNEVGCFNNIKSHGQFVNGQLVFEDWDYWLRLSQVTNFRYFEQPLSYYKRGSIRKITKKVINAISTK